MRLAIFSGSKAAAHVVYGAAYFFESLLEFADIFHRWVSGHAPGIIPQRRRRGKHGLIVCAAFSRGSAAFFVLLTPAVAVW
jgi:hypothetical protein